MRSNEFDVLVIGEGLSGICAAATACQNGARVVLVSKGPGTFMLGSGCIDLAELDAPDGASLPFNASDMGPAISAFVELTLAAGSSYEGGLGERRLVPSSFGTFTEVSLAPVQLWKGDPRAFAKATVFGFENVFPFDANFVAERLSQYSRNKGLTTSFRPANITLPHIHSNPWLTLLEIATDFDRSVLFRQALIDALKPVVQDADLLILPGVLGLNSSDAEIRRIEDEIGCAICELPTIPPSVPGLRLSRRLEAHLAARGVEIRTGFAVQDLCIEAGRCAGASLETPGRTRRIRADSVIVAAGRFSHLLPEGAEHPSESRVRVSEDLQPINGAGDVIAENLFACGSVLGKIEGRDRNAIDLVTGYEAGMLACRQGVHCAQT